LAWQLLYRDADANVDMSIKASADGRTVSVEGQARVLVGDPPSEGAIAFRRAAAGDDEPAAASASLGAQGSFTLEAIPVGRYDVAIDLGDRHIVLPDVEF
jgi:hypothetical protein